MAIDNESNTKTSDSRSAMNEATLQESVEGIRASRIHRWYDPRWCWDDPKSGTILFGIFYAIADGFLILLFVKWAQNFGQDNLPMALGVQTQVAAGLASFYATWFILDCILVAVALRKVGLQGCQVWLIATLLRYVHLIIDPTLLVYTCTQEVQCAWRVLPSALSLSFLVPLPLAQMMVSKHVRQLRRQMQLQLQVKRLHDMPLWMAQRVEALQDSSQPYGLSTISERDEDKEKAEALGAPKSQTSVGKLDRNARQGRGRGEERGGKLLEQEQELMALVHNLQHVIVGPEAATAAGAAVSASPVRSPAGRSASRRSSRAATPESSPRPTTPPPFLAGSRSARSSLSTRSAHSALSDHRSQRRLRGHREPSKSSAEPRGSGERRGSREHKESRENKESRDHKEIRLRKESRENKDSSEHEDREHKESRERKDSKKHLEPRKSSPDRRENTELRRSRDKKESREQRESKVSGRRSAESRKSRELREIREFKESRENMDSRGPNKSLAEPRESRKFRGSTEHKKTKEHRESSKSSAKPRGSKELRGSRERKKSRGYSEARETWEQKEGRGYKDSRESRDSREVGESSESREQRESRENALKEKRSHQKSTPNLRW